MRIILAILFLCWSIFTKAQADSAFTSTFLNSFKYKPKPVFTMGTRNAFVSNDFAKMRHAFIGMNYQNITRLGISFNWLSDGLQRKVPTVFVDSFLTKDVRMLYIAPHIEYVFYQTDHWELNIPVQIGMGLSYLKYKNAQNHIIRENKGFVMLYDPAMTIQYRFLRYFALGGGAGIRLMIKNNKQLAERFTSPVYMIWFKVFFGDIYKDYVKKGS